MAEELQVLQREMVGYEAEIRESIFVEALAEPSEDNDPAHESSLHQVSKSSFHSEL